MNKKIFINNVRVMMSDLHLSPKVEMKVQFPPTKETIVISKSYAYTVKENKNEEMALCSQQL